MKNYLVINRFKTIVWAIILFLFTGCGEYFNDPLIDKETGEDINLFIIDFNFFTTKATYKLLNADDGTLIQKEANISFSGQNANDIVTFTGEKKENFQTSVGQLELTFDPNVPVSESTPLEYAVHIEIEGYNTVSKGIQIYNEGDKTYELHLSKTADNEESDVIGDIIFGLNKSAILSTNSILKSTGIEDKPYTINFTVTATDLLEFEDNEGKLFSDIDDLRETYNNYKLEGIPFIIFNVTNSNSNPPGIDVISVDGVKRNVLFQILETGTVNKIFVMGREVTKFNDGKFSISSNYPDEATPVLFGFTEFENSYWNMLGTTITQNALNQNYTFAKVIEDTVCEIGGSISFNSSLNSSFSIDVDIYDMEDNFVSSMNFKGNFPETIVFENVPLMPVKLKFRNNNPAFAPIPPMEIEDLCNGDYEVNVTPNSDYVEFEIVLSAFCDDNRSIGIAPSYSAEIKLKNSDDPWQGIKMEGGIANVLGKLNSDYELRLLWEDEWQNSTYSTKFDENGNYLGAAEAQTKINSEIIEDGRIQIKIETIFDQNICNDLGW